MIYQSYVSFFLFYYKIFNQLNNIKFFQLQRQVCTMRQEKQNKNPNQIPATDDKKLFNNYRLQQKLVTGSSNDEMMCKDHLKEIGKYFCVDCFRYNICLDCISQTHYNHNFLQFKGFEESKQFTKQLILQEVQETLKKLKSKENQVNNQIAEISIIKNKLKAYQNQIIAQLRNQFEQLQNKITQKFDLQYQKYQKQLDIFYEQHNHVNDYLRKNLIEVIDSEIDIFHFQKNYIYQQIDQKYVPKFGKIKLTMQKCKKYYKNINENLKGLGCSIKYFNNKEEKTNRKFQKYDKFLKQKTVNQIDYCSPLLKTLNLIEKNECYIPLLLSKLRN